MIYALVKKEMKRAKFKEMDESKSFFCSEPLGSIGAKAYWYSIYKLYFMVLLEVLGLRKWI